MADNKINIGGRLHSIATGNVVAGADEIFDDIQNKKQNLINQDTYQKVGALEEAVGTGGSIDARIDAAISEAIEDCAFLGEDDGSAVIADFDPQVDTLWKGEQILSNAEKAQVKENLGLDDDLENIEGKISTLGATVSGHTTAIELLQELYRGLSQSDIVVVDDHTAVVSPEENTIYREPGDSSYTDWMYYNGSWVEMATYNNAVDDKPVSGSNNLVKSGGVADELALGAVYDVSAKNPTAGTNNDGKWESLSALLSDANLNTLIPTSVRKGGMSIKFVQSSDNKYVQFHLVADSFTTDTIYWVNDAETKSLKSIDGTVVKCYDNDIIVYDGSIYISDNLTLTASGNLAWGHTSSIIPIPADADMVYFTNVKSSAAKYIFTDENNSFLCAVAIPNADTRDYIECPIPPQAKGFVCNANKTYEFKLLFAKSNSINLVRSWGGTHDESDALRPYYAYISNKLYISLREGQSIEITGNPDKVYKYNDKFYIWKNVAMVAVNQQEAAVIAKLNYDVEELMDVSFNNVDLGSSIFNENVAPGTWEANQYYKSCIRSAKGIDKIVLTTWGLSSHCVFSAKDIDGNIIEASKVYATGSTYQKETIKIPILDTYDTYIAGHIANIQNTPADSEADLEEITSIKTKVNELVKRDEYIIDSSMFGGSAATGDCILEDGSVGHSGSCSVTDFIDCSKYNQIEVNVRCRSLVYCAFYLERDVATMFSVFQTGASGTSTRTHKVVAIPDGVKYVRLTNVNSFSNPNAVLRKVNNWWENRKIAIYGTSVPAGYPYGSSQQDIADGKQNIYSFVNAAILNIGAIPLNFCVPSGAMRASKVDGTVNAPQYAFASDAELTPDFGPNGLQNVTYKNSMLPLIDTDDEPDLFLFATYGTNDGVYDHTDFEDGYTPDYTSTQPNTFVGAYNKVLKALYDAYPYARVGIMTTTRDAIADNEYVKNANDQTVEIARLWEAPCMKLHLESGLIANGIVDNRAAWIKSYDKIHPANFNRSKGTELLPRLAKLTEEWLKSIA